MSASPRREAIETVLNSLLRNEWSPNYTHDVTPHIHLGWVNDDEDRAEVTISNPDEEPVNGGDTGYAGTKGDGTGVFQDIDGIVNVNVWDDAERSGVHPPKYVHACKEEIAHIIRGNSGCPTSSDYARLSYMGGNRHVESEENPTRFRYRIIVGYGYHT